MNHRVSTQPHAGTAAELYDRTFVPSIAVPVSGPLLEQAQLQRGEDVLDVACGTGIIARLAAERVGPGGTVTGVDVSADMITVARSLRAPASPAIDWREADAAALPLPADTVDVALCQMGLMFFKDKASALAETRRVLRTGGRVVVSTPGVAQPPLEILGNALAEHVSPQVGSFVRAVFSLHDPSAVAGMLVEAGFDDVQATTSVIPLDLPSPVEFLWQYIGSTPLGPVVNRASVETKSALERDVVGQWQAFVDGQGRLAIDQPMVYARATAP